MKGISCRKVGCFLISLIFISFAYCFFVYPVALDDYWFLSDFKAGREAGGNVVDGLVNFWDWRIHYDNGRLANMIGIAFLLLPKWITAAISVIELLVSYLLMCRLAGVTRRDFNAAALMAVFVAVGFPWHDSIFTSVYSFNYLWAVPLMLIAAVAALRATTTNCFLMFAGGVLLGGWHEIYSLPVLVALGIMMLAGFLQWRRDRVFLLAGLCVGLAWLMLIPAWSNRVGADVSLTPSSYMLVQLMYHFMGWLPFMSLWLICLCVKKWRKVVVDPVVMFVFIACLVIIGVQLTVLKARAGFPAFILSYIGLVRILRQVWQSAFIGNRMPASLIMTILLGLVAVHMAVVDVYMKRMADELSAIKNVYDRHTERPVTIFADITYDWEIPPFVLKKTFFERHSHGWHYKCYNMWSKLPLHHIVPASLKYYRAGMGDEIEGTADARLWNGYLVMPFKSRLATVWVSYGNDLRESDLSIFHGADGGCYYFVNPSIRTWEFGKRPVSADIQRMVTP